MTSSQYQTRHKNLLEKLEDAEKLEKYNDQVVILKELFNLEKANNDTYAAFTHALELLRVEVFETSRCIESFPIFTWILETFDNNPDCEFDEDDFLWEYKWMISSAIDNSNISLEQIEIILEDFKIRLERNNNSLRSYYSLKRFLAFNTNNMEEAEKYLKLTNSTSRDFMTDCAACEKDAEIDFYLEKKDFKKALLVGENLIKGKLSCHSVPLSSFCSLTLAFHRAGEKEKAQEFFERAKKELAKSESESNVSQVSKLINYLASTDEEEAWSFFEKYVGWNINSEEKLELNFNTDVLMLLKTSGEKALKISIKVPWYKVSGIYNIEELYAYYYNRAKELASAFDKRDKGNFYTKKLEREK